jgi:glutamate synthase (NADPH/NADH) small chain
MVVKMIIEMPKQEAKARVNNFDEVNLGYNKEQAVKEASRCLQCSKPQCVAGCPVNIDIPKFIKYIKEGKAGRAIKVIKKTNNLPGVCGRVCPQEDQCEKLCILTAQKKPVAVGYLERYASENEESLEVPKIEKNGKKVAIVGSGPAGLTCAADLAVKGFKVVMLEALHKAGGVLTYGIPEFRLPKKIVENEVKFIEELGVEIVPNSIVGQLHSLDEMIGKFDAVFIGSGAGLPYFLKIPGENLRNVYSANEFLTRVNLMKAYKFPEYKTPIKRGGNVVVVGGGNVAMDAARTARRLGSNVTIVYRRSFDEMPARREEIHHAKEEGIQFLLLTNPVRVVGKENVSGVECVQMMLGEPDESGRRRPVPIENSEFIVECDTFVVAIGQGPNPLITKTSQLRHNAKGNLIVNENLMTSKPGVFAGGDIVASGENATVIKAMGDGKLAAKSIEFWVKQEKLIKEEEVEE